MAYDEGLTGRIRQRPGSDPDVTQRRMFGGMAFLYRGNMAVGVSGDDLMVRSVPTTPTRTWPGPRHPPPRCDRPPEVRLDPRRRVRSHRG
ncbi:TfoX/Sxy family protein [Streptomyces sp. AS02]|uniref:TfoX/Sxy family protein n=1 Tax=Streptomyces sp. AS02 TaxID=2938946 RepID=UPI0034D538E9